MKRAVPQKSYVRQTKYGPQWIVPAKNTVAKRKRYEKIKVEPKDTKDEPEQREA
jgi:hypothetical protein